MEKEQLELTARELKHDLGGSIEERLKAERTVYIVMNQGMKPEVIYTGFWNGKMVNNAQNALARAYRGLVHKNMRANVLAPNKGEGDARDNTART